MECPWMSDAAKHTEVIICFDWIDLQAQIVCKVFLTEPEKVFCEICFCRFSQLDMANSLAKQCAKDVRE